MTPAETTHKSTMAEKELRSLAQKSQKESVLSVVNLEILKDRFQQSDILPKVKIDLLREQDRKQPKRIGLAIVIAQSMKTSLAKDFTASQEGAKLVLLAHVTVVSNGCKRWAQIAGHGTPQQGEGLSKLTISYSLYHRETGDVALAKQMSTCKVRGMDDKETMLAMEHELTTRIRNEIKFLCCSTVPGWEELSKNMVEVNCQDTGDKESAAATDPTTISPHKFSTALWFQHVHATRT